MTEAGTNNSFKLSGQSPFCGYALSLDLYSGCPHRCLYCFARTLYKFMSQSSLKEGFADKIQPRSTGLIEKLIRGQGVTKAADLQLVQWLVKRRQPIHIGGVADPFPTDIPLDYAKRFIRSIGDYPIIWSTKTPPPELGELLVKGNHVLQLSGVGLGLKARDIEPGVKGLEDRLSDAQALKGAVKKLVFRLQPFIPWLLSTGGEGYDPFERLLDAIAMAEFDAVTVEFLKVSRSALSHWGEFSEIIGLDIANKYLNAGFTEGSDFVFSPSYRLEIINYIRDSVHSRGLEFYSAENRYRDLGDGGSCCGIADDDPIFKTRMPWVWNEMLFLAKKKGIIFWEDVLERIPEEVRAMSSQALGGNAGDRKTSLTKRYLLTIEDLLLKYWKSEHPLNPSVFFESLKRCRDQRSEHMAYRYERRVDDE